MTFLMGVLVNAPIPTVETTAQKTDLCQHAHELFCRKVDVHAEEVVSGVFFARLCKGRPTHVQHVEVSKYATHWSVRPCRGWWRKEWCREICWEVRPWHLDRLPNAIALHHQGECRCALVSATALHCERVADIRPQASHRIMLKTRSDLGANSAARPKQRPWPIQAVWDRVFRTKRRITLTTVDALTDLSALQRDIIIAKTLHGLIVP